MKILLGPAGSPAPSTLEGVSRIRELGLQCMEVQFSHGIKMSDDLARRIGEERNQQGIELSIHAPYYINLASMEKEKIEASKKRILKSCEKGHYMGARKVVFHPAYFSGRDKETVYQTAKKHVKDMLAVIKKKGWNVLLAPETTGKHSALGSLEEVLRLSEETGCSICVDFAHLFARNNGGLDYNEIFGKIRPLKPKHLHCHFSGIEYTEKGEKNHTVLDGGEPDFEEFAKAVLGQKWLDSITIVSETPITWKDSLRMKEIFTRLGYKW